LFSARKAHDQYATLHTHTPQFSFPSGHTLRAAYVAVWLANSRFVAAALDHILPSGGSAPSFLQLLPWVVAVGWSRCAKGRHFPLDTLVGGCIGTLFGYTNEVHATAATRAYVKIVGGIAITAFWGPYFLAPAVARRGSPVYAAVLVFFYLLYTTVFFVTLPEDAEHLGRQTL
jgi:hypothetical protein